MAFTFLAASLRSSLLQLGWLLASVTAKGLRTQYTPTGTLNRLLNDIGFPGTLREVLAGLVE